MSIYAKIVDEDPALAAVLREVAATVNREQNKGRLQRSEDVRQVPQLGPLDSIEVAPIGPSVVAAARRTKRPTARNPKIGRKRSPERMRMVLDALRQYPILARAAAKAGIHYKTLTYWLKCSAAEHDGYDIEWQGETWRFHEHCESAIAEAHDTLDFVVWHMAMGIKFKTDPSLIKRGYGGIDAYARDENGNFIEDGVRRPNLKMMLVYLAWKRPETWGKRRKKDVFRTGGVLVIGERSAKPKDSYTGSIKARQWKSISRNV